MVGRRRAAAQSRKYELMSVWYGIPVSAARFLKYAIVLSSIRIVTDRFSRFAYGFGRALLKSYSFLMA